GASAEQGLAHAAAVVRVAEQPLVNRGPEHARAGIDRKARQRVLEIRYVDVARFRSVDDMARRVDRGDGTAAVLPATQRDGGDRDGRDDGSRNQRVLQRAAPWPAVVVPGGFIACPGSCMHEHLLQYRTG